MVWKWCRRRWRVGGGGVGVGVGGVEVRRSVETGFQLVEVNKELHWLWENCPLFLFFDWTEAKAEFWSGRVMAHVFNLKLIIGRFFPGQMSKKRYRYTIDIGERTVRSHWLGSYFDHAIGSVPCVIIKCSPEPHYRLSKATIGRMWYLQHGFNHPNYFFCNLQYRIFSPKAVRRLYRCRCVRMHATFNRKRIFADI